MKRVLIVGAGGHAQVVADALLGMVREEQQLVVIGFLDDAATLHGQQFLGLPVLGPLASINEIPHDAIVLGIGNNQVRRRLYHHLQDSEKFITAIHPRAVVAKDVPIGSGTVLCAGATVNTGSIVGKNVILNTNCTVSHHNRVADFAQVADGATTGGEVTIEEGVFVGLAATILPRRRIGKWAVVGAGAVVIRDVPDGVTVVGVPARPIR